MVKAAVRVRARVKVRVRVCHVLPAACMWVRLARPSLRSRQGALVMQHEESLLRMPALLPALLRRPLRRPPVSRSGTLLGRRRAAAAAAAAAPAAAATAAAAIEVCCRACGGGRRLEPEPPLAEPLPLTEGAVRLVLELVGRMHGEGPTGVDSKGA